MNGAAAEFVLEGLLVKEDGQSACAVRDAACFASDGAHLLKGLTITHSSAVHANYIHCSDKQVVLLAALYALLAWYN